MYNLVFFVPRSHKEKVKNALFNAGAGQIGDYSNCCWEVWGMGQFLPFGSSNPFIGISGRLKKLKEYRVEMVLEDHLVAQIIEKLIETHPYEVPAYHYYQVNS